MDNVSSLRNAAVKGQEYLESNKHWQHTLNNKVQPQNTNKEKGDMPICQVANVWR